MKVEFSAELTQADDQLDERMQWVEETYQELWIDNISEWFSLLPPSEELEMEIEFQQHDVELIKETIRALAPETPRETLDKVLPTTMIFMHEKRMPKGVSLPWVACPPDIEPDNVYIVLDPAKVLAGVDDTLH